MAEIRDPTSGRRFDDEEMAWLARHSSESRRDVAEGHVRYQVLWSGLVIGLIVHVIGYLLKSAAAGEPMGVLADLLYTFGWALWTGVVVVSLVEIIPAAKERQISRYLDAYESAVRSRPGVDAAASRSAQAADPSPRRR